MGMSRTGISLSILWWIYGDEVLRVGELARGLLNGCKDKGLFIATYKRIQFKNFLCHFLLKSSGPPLLSYPYLLHLLFLCLSHNFWCLNLILLFCLPLAFPLSFFALLFLCSVSQFIFVLWGGPLCHRTFHRLFYSIFLLAFLQFSIY